MDLINKTVIYKAMMAPAKRATITKKTEDRIYIDLTDKAFAFPEAFEKFLTFEDAALQGEMMALIAQKKEAAARKDAEERERRRAEEERRRAEEEQRREAERRRTAPAAYDRHADENNLAFKCNFCDGGSAEGCLGFKSVCTPEQIRYNIETKRRTWCSDETRSLCYQYHKNKISREELEAAPFVCYESHMLTEWKAEAGEDTSDKGALRARRITGAARNGLAVLTTERPREKERIIFGVFITGLVEEGNDARAGYVQAKEDYHIELTPAEAEKMPFWKYHKNAKQAEKKLWGSGLFRYMKDAACARILADIVDIKEDQQEKEHARRVLAHYCELKGIDINAIPEADGAM